MCKLPKICHFSICRSWVHSYGLYHVFSGFSLPSLFLFPSLSWSHLSFVFLHLPLPSAVPWPHSSAVGSQIPSKEEATGHLWGSALCSITKMYCKKKKKSPLLIFLLGLMCPKEREVLWKWAMIWLNFKSRTWKEKDYRIGARKFRGEEFE